MRAHMDTLTGKRGPFADAPVAIRANRISSTPVRDLSANPRHFDRRAFMIFLARPKPVDDDLHSRSHRAVRRYYRATTSGTYSLVIRYYRRFERWPREGLDDLRPSLPAHCW